MHFHNINIPNRNSKNLIPRIKVLNMLKELRAVTEVLI